MLPDEKHDPWKDMSDKASSSCFVADVFCCIYQTETGQQNNCYEGKLNGQHHPHSDLKSAGTEVYKNGKV